MVLLRGIVFLVLLVVGTFVSAAAQESFASTAMPAASQSVMAHADSDPAAKDHCATIAILDRHGTDHDGCCGDMTCGTCAHSSIAPLQSTDAPSLLLDAKTSAAPVTELVGINIAPETGPPKTYA